MESRLRFVSVVTLAASVVGACSQSSATGPAATTEPDASILDAAKPDSSRDGSIADAASQDAGDKPIQTDGSKPDIKGDGGKPPGGKKDGGVPAFEALCKLPFEIGTCFASIGVYAYDPIAFACLPKIYGGCGGNDNRFDTHAQCEQACPAPKDCEPGRVLTEVCVQCGFAGGCAAQVFVCAKPCEDGADCAGDPVGSACVAGSCATGFCI